MAIDYQKAENYLSEIKKIEDILESHQELFDKEKLREFKQVTTSLDHNIRISQQDSRKLSIGIVGAVKAGKSSFLNACIFGGQDYLPKAATPMTAVLTRITYSEKPKAIIHFYKKEDWDQIVQLSEEYDKRLQKAYDEYTKGFHQRLIMQVPHISCMSLDEYERQYKCDSEILQGAKELTSMVKVKVDLLEKLGETDEIDGDIISKLNDYVGVKGTYTPIVKYVELQVDNPKVKDLEIVDTPGLNDPIVSRGIETKQFLRLCDVVVLLSPCSQFMDAQTVALMANSLPDAGVHEILVVGSKLDSGILNESCNDFGEAYNRALHSYKAQFSKNLTQVKNRGKYLELLNKLDPSKVLFVSSICFGISKKKKSNIRLDPNEKKVLDNLHGCFEKNFKDEYLSSLGGMGKVHKAFNEVLNRKVEIIEKKNGELLDNAKRSHSCVLERILTEIASSRTMLEKTSVDELEQHSSNIKDVIDSSRGKLLHIFEGARIKCYKKVQQILPQLNWELRKYQNIAVDSTTHDEHTTERVGFLGLRKEIVHYTVTENSADTSNVIDNIRQYSAKCCMYVNDEFENIFNKEEFAQKIKEIVLAAFNQSEKRFDKDEILIPLQNVLDKISTPKIKFDFTKYIDEVETRFKSGYAKNEEIHQLANLQSKLLNNIEVEITTQLMNALEDISNILRKQGSCFADQIENVLCSELEKLKGQIEEKECYIIEYQEFAEQVRKIKANISVL